MQSATLSRSTLLKSLPYHSCLPNQVPRLDQKPISGWTASEPPARGRRTGGLRGLRAGARNPGRRPGPPTRRDSGSAGFGHAACPAGPAPPQRGRGQPPCQWAATGPCLGPARDWGWPASGPASEKQLPSPVESGPTSCTRWARAPLPPRFCFNVTRRQMARWRTAVAARERRRPYFFDPHPRTCKVGVMSRVAVADGNRAP